MTEDLYLWPRLVGSVASDLYERVRASDVVTLREEAALSHDLAAAVSPGGTAAPQELIGKVRSRIRDLADDQGFPVSPTRARVSDFDRPATAILYDEMRIVPADAGSEGVWNFLSLVVLPDVALWRYPNGARDRLMGRPRNVFRKLWWRAFYVGTDVIDVEDGLGEDEFVNVMERTAIAANPAVARAIANEVFQHGRTSGIARSELMRDVAKRVLRLMGVLTLNLLKPEELSAVVSTCYNESVDAMRSSASGRK